MKFARSPAGIAGIRGVDATGQDCSSAVSIIESLLATGFQQDMWMMHAPAALAVQLWCFSCLNSC
jgi:hypothetical protein